MLEKVKLSLRISLDDFDSELNDLIAAAKSDLKTSGIQVPEGEDSLALLAVTQFVKAHFGNDEPNSEKYKMSYNEIKNKMALLLEYKIPEVQNG